MTHAMAQPQVRRPEIVQNYFVAPPDPLHHSAGRTFTGLGACLIVLAFFLPFFAGALASSEDPYAGRSAGEEFGILLFQVLAFLGGNLLGWPALVYGLRRRALYNRQAAPLSMAPSDAEMDRWFQEDLAGLKEYALREIGLAPDTFIREPLVVVGPSLPTDYGIGRDGIARFSSYEAMVVCLSEATVGVFICVISSLTGRITLETTHEFALADVTSISTFNDRTVSHGGGGSDGRTVRQAVGLVLVNYLTQADVNVRQEFRINLNNGESVAVTVGCHLNGTNLSHEGFRQYIKKTVKALRGTLREIKGR